MDQKTWGWKRKPSEKSLIKQKAFELEKSIEELHEEMSKERAKSSEKDVLLDNKTKLAEQAIAGWEKAEAETLSFKDQLDHTLNVNQTLEETITKRDETIKEYMQKLQAAKEEQELTIIDSMRKINLEQDKIRILEETLTEKNNKIATLGAEINHLLKTLKEVHETRLQLESSLNQTKFRVEQMEKSNSSLKYELCMLQKEVEIRSQEREFDHKSANLAQKQNVENVKKIAKLEAECQRLRVMVRKRLPGPQAVAKMRNEVEILGFGNNTSNNNHMKSNNSKYLLEKFNAMEEENKTLKETLVRKNNELQSVRAMNFRNGSKIEEDNLSCIESGSWTSALISEIDHFKAQKPTNTPTYSCKSPTAFSDLSLMDDFAEMEKLALEDNKSSVTTKENESKVEKEILERHVSRIIEFVEGLVEKSAEGKYVARAFLWEGKGLKGVLQNFGLVCNDLIIGRTKVENFVGEICVVLDWVVNHCFSLQDVSEMRETILKDFGEKESNCCNEIEVFLNSPCNNINITRGLCENGLKHKNEKIENGGEISGNASELQEKVEGELKELLEKERILNGEENGEDFNGDGNKNGEENRVKTESNNSDATSKDENTAKCVTAVEENPNGITGQVEKQVKIDSQETVSTLGDQLKSVASPKEAILFDKFENPVFTPTKDIIIAEQENHTSTTRRSLEAEFNATDDLSKKSTESVPTISLEPLKDGPKSQLRTLALVPKRQQEETNLLRKLLMRRKKESYKKLTLPIGT
ncbi:hypothetical protein LUZ60_003017 [Juncus effusus]|nr:hypothetical protein LUZ60_003017 [Juncus effusus]